MAEMTLVVDPTGMLTCIYTEQIDLAELGTLQITRASHVEPDEQGQWRADLSPVGGPILGSFSCRSQALAAELDWLETWLVDS